MPKKPAKRTVSKRTTTAAKPAKIAARDRSQENAQLLPEGFRALQEIRVDLIDPNPENPRLVFPQEEIDRLAESIDQAGILVPLVVYETDKGRFTLIDGERRFKCALLLGLKTVPAVVADPKSPRENLVEMFNIHLIREPWRDMPTAWALQKLIGEMKKEKANGQVSDGELSRLTGLSRERLKRLRHALELPKEYQKYIHEGTIPLNWFWELKENVITPLGRRRPTVMNEFGQKGVLKAFVSKRIRGVITDTVSLRDVRPIINHAGKDADESGSDTSILDETLRLLITDPDLTIQEAYEDTVQIMVEVDKLERRTNNMLKSFERLISKVRTSDELEKVKSVGNAFVKRLRDLIKSA